MGLFDSISGGLAGQLGGQGQNGNLLAAAAKLIGSRDVGGLSGLLQLFNQKGKGDAVASWVSSDENRPISPDEVEGVLGHDRVQRIADEAGMSEPEASRGLSSLLPQLVDKLTPDGKVPDNDSADNTLSQLASRFLGSGR